VSEPAREKNERSGYIYGAVKGHGEAMFTALPVVALCAEDVINKKSDFGLQH